MSEAGVERAEDRIPTGVPGLDTVLRGGFLRGGMYILQGRPGAGKTILASQVCFHHVAQGGRVLYTTLLAESHERLLFNLRPMRFFDAARIPEDICYLSAFSELEEAGLKGVVGLLSREMRARRASLLVVDGLVSVEESAESKREFKKFIHEVQVHAALHGCTVLLLTSSGGEGVRPEHTMVDGILELADKRIGHQAQRELEVKKFRGSGYLRGGHSFRISDEGLRIFPRLDVLLREPSRPDPCLVERLSTGVERLDAMTGGGLPCGSSTVLLGPTGSGKTTLALQFLARCSEREPGLHFSFYERPERVLLKGHALGLPLEEEQRKGTLELLWYAPTERILDELGERLLDAVRARGVRRLVVDGLDGFMKSSVYAERVPHFLAALTNELRALGVTTVYTLELQSVFGAEVLLPMSGVSVLVENMLLLRFVELRSQLYRLLSILKLRDGDYDSALREFRITSHGVELADTFESAEAILTGEARPTGKRKKRTGKRKLLPRRRAKRP